MPKAEIQTTTVTVILEASESSIDALADKALSLYRAVRGELPPPSSISMGAGSHLERRGTYSTPAHIDAGDVR